MGGWYCHGCCSWSQRLRLGLGCGGDSRGLHRFPRTQERRLGGWYMAHSPRPWGCRRKWGEACRLLFPETRPEGPPSLAVVRGDAIYGSI